jgi:hypothetical protein
MAVVVLIVAAAVMVRHAPTGKGSTRTTAPAAPAAPSAAGAQPGLAWHPPVTAAAAGSPVQQQYDQAFAQGLGGQPGMFQAGALAVPRPAAAGGWPLLAVADTPQQWAREFVAGLLDVNYSVADRQDLGGWLEAEEAPELLAGVPGTVADKVLYVSLLDPGLFGGQPTPVPSAPQWAGLARDRVRASVSDLLVQPDPSWSQMVAAGWQPADPRMTQLDVSGALTVSGGPEPGLRHFALTLLVGSARWHDGYGTIAVANWQETAQ